MTSSRSSSIPRSMNDHLEEAVLNIQVALSRIARSWQFTGNEELAEAQAELEQALRFLREEEAPNGSEKPYGFTFSGEAYEWFAGVCDNATGLCVRVTTEEGQEFDAEMVGHDHEGGWATSILVRAWDDERGQGIGVPFSARARNIHIY